MHGAPARSTRPVQCARTGIRKPAHRRRNDERHVPTGVLEQRPGHDRRQRDAKIACKAVEADREPRTGRALHEHRNAYRMVDRGERAEQRQRRRQLPRRARHRDEQRRDAHAEKEYEHHPSPAPEVAQPSRGQRAQPEHRERADAVRHQVFPAREPEVRGDRRHRGREDQQEHVVDRVRHVQQQHRRSRQRRHVDAFAAVAADDQRDALAHTGNSPTGQRLADVVALRGIAPDRGQRAPYRLFLDAFGDRAHVRAHGTARPSSGRSPPTAGRRPSGVRTIGRS